MQVGDRVIAIESVNNGVIRSFGEGVYAGVDAEECSPRIDLDSGGRVFGRQCWWGAKEAMDKRFPPAAYKIELIKPEE